MTTLSAEYTIWSLVLVARLPKRHNEWETNHIHYTFTITSTKEKVIFQPFSEELKGKNSCSGTLGYNIT